MNQKGIGYRLIGGMIIALVILLILAPVLKGPLNSLGLFVPKLEKPGVEPLSAKLEGLIRYGVEDGKIQFYRDIQFENAVPASDGTLAFFINGNALKESETKYNFQSYYDDYFIQSSSRTEDVGYKFSGSGAPDFLKLFDSKTNGDTEVEIKIAGIANAENYDKSSMNGLPIDNLLKGDVVIFITGNKGTRYNLILRNDDKIYFKGTAVSYNNPDYLQMRDYAIKWRDSVLEKPMAIKVYGTNGKEILNDKCGMFEVPIVKVASISGKGFDLTADLSNAKYVTSCSTIEEILKNNPNYLAQLIQHLSGSLDGAKCDTLDKINKKDTGALMQLCGDIEANPSDIEYISDCNVLDNINGDYLAQVLQGLSVKPSDIGRRDCP